jgi:hypothetical protein
VTVGDLAVQSIFFFGYLVVISFPNRIDVCLGQIMYTFRGRESHDFCICHLTFLKSEHSLAL